jgi:putative membrane protein
MDTPGANPSGRPPGPVEARSPAPPGDSHARDHLANERTYLAWMRTSIALLGFGVILTRLPYLSPGPRDRFAEVLGLVLAVTGLLIVLLSTVQFFGVRRSIETQDYRPGARLVIAFSLVIGATGLAVIYFLATG